MHRVIDPSILYFGTPVVLVSSLNEDGSPNVAPMSSAWWLGWTGKGSPARGERSRAQGKPDRSGGPDRARLAEIPESA